MAASAATAGVFNRQAMLRRLMNDDELVNTVLRRFLQDLPTIGEQFLAACRDGDAPTLCAQAHRLKGTASTVGGEQLAEWTLRMELLAKQGRLPEARALLPGATAALEALRRAVELSLPQP
jgi:HPt (histidine-containing phosphotransfer) domain-containing protein